MASRRPIVLVAGQKKELPSGDVLLIGTSDTVSGTNTGDQVGDGVTITGAGTVANPFVATASGGDSASMFAFAAAYG